MEPKSDTHHSTTVNEGDFPFGDWRIPSPGSYTILGPSQSGKSELLIKLLKNPSIWIKKPKIVIYAAPSIDDRKDYIKRMSETCKETDESEFYATKVVPDEEKVRQMTEFRDQPVILILDDLLSFSDKTNIKKATQLGIKGCHHGKITLFMCLQNPFPQGYPDFVTLSRNTTGKFIMYQTNDLRSIRNINSSMFPGTKDFLLYCLFKAKTKLNCRYIFTNNSSFSPVDRRYLVYTCLLPSERPGPEPYHFDLDYYLQDLHSTDTSNTPTTSTFSRGKGKKRKVVELHARADTGKQARAAAAVASEAELPAVSATLPEEKPSPDSS
jgi:hypothetical protein